MAAALERVPLALYFDHDTRQEVQDCSHVIKRLAPSIACLIPEWNLDRNRDGSYTFKNIKNLTDKVKERTGYPLIDEATFRNQDCPGVGSAFAVTRNTVMTAGHCSDAVFSDKLKVVFNFCLGKKNFDANEVYDVKHVMQDYTKGNLERPDWGWMLLDRDIEGRDPLNVERIPIIELPPIESKSPISMLGHPSGISMKYCEGNVEAVDHPNYFTAKIDAFGGNSGSPIFNDEGDVIGILYSGYGDHDAVDDYKGTGKTRTKWKRIQRNEYGQCHRMSQTMLAIADRIYAYCRYTLNEKIKGSNDWSEFEYRGIKSSIDWEKRHKFLGFLHAVIDKINDDDCYAEDKKEYHESMGIVNSWKGEINYSEAKALRKIKALVYNQDDKVKQITIVRNMVAYQVNQRHAIMINQFEEIFQKCFKLPYSRESVHFLLRR
jgi:V8-like Glu-specific endopeptidase